MRNEMEPKEDDEFVEPPIMDEFEALIDEQIALSRMNVGGKAMDQSISGIELNMLLSQSATNLSFSPTKDFQNELET